MMKQYICYYKYNKITHGHKIQNMSLSTLGLNNLEKIKFISKRQRFNYLWDRAITELRGKCIVQNPHIKTKEEMEINRWLRIWKNCMRFSYLRFYVFTGIHVIYMKYLWLIFFRIQSKCRLIWVSNQWTWGV